jgi:hypothetical protein
MNTKIIMRIYIAFILLIAFSCENEPIEIQISSIELASSSGIIEVGLTDTLELLIYPENASNAQFNWSSSEPSIAEVSPDGVVSGISPGVAIISATTKDNGFTVTDTVHVIRWTNFDMENVNARPIAVDSLDNVWCGGMELTRIADDYLQVYQNIKHVSAIAAYSIENKWFGTWDLGIWKFDGSNWINYSESNSGLSYNRINQQSMILDLQGNLWFGTVKDTYGTGVTMYDGTQWQSFDSNDGLVNNAVKNIAVDSNDNKWFVANYGISKYDGSNWVSYTSENTGVDLIDYVFSIAIDSEDNKWFGSYKGALKFDGTNWTVYNTSNSGLEWNHINAIAVDKDDNIWFANESGVSSFDGTNWINYSSVNRTESKVYNCRAIAIDSKGNKWIGTSYGVIKLED